MRSINDGLFEEQSKILSFEQFADNNIKVMHSPAIYNEKNEFIYASAYQYESFDLRSTLSRIRSTHSIVRLIQTIGRLIKDLISMHIETWGRLIQELFDSKKLIDSLYLGVDSLRS